ncbi:hypothetical protein BX600DRAFT_414779 [Xylariales sp. PMI_506]|nr:hypothetical protein BX600DRAFT_414779 [Xylariales sp. PMI_506]
MSKSLILGPPQETPGALFWKSQFKAQVQWPPTGTSLKGKAAMVTGSTGGLGREASRQLLDLGLSCLILAVRSPSKGELVASAFRTQYPEADIRVWELEMESYKSVQALARRAEVELPRLDIAILNAASQPTSYTTATETGHEMYVQVNYLATVLLALLLLPVLQRNSKTTGSEAQPSRLSIVSSGTARGAKLREYPTGTSILAGLDNKALGFNAFTRYAESKLLGHLFMAELGQRYPKIDGVVFNLVDPGLVKGTDLQRHSPFPISTFLFLMKAAVARPLPIGASTYIDAVAVKGPDSHGCVISNWEISSFAAFVYTPEGEKSRQRLWQETMAEFEFAGVQQILNGL